MKTLAYLMVFTPIGMAFYYGSANTIAEYPLLAILIVLGSGILAFSKRKKPITPQKKQVTKKKKPTQSPHNDNQGYYLYIPPNAQVHRES